MRYRGGRILRRAETFSGKIMPYCYLFYHISRENSIYAEKKARFVNLFQYFG